MLPLYQMDLNLLQRLINYKDLNAEDSGLSDMNI